MRKGSLSPHFLVTLNFEYKIECRKFRYSKYCKVLVLILKYSVASLGVAYIARSRF